jgi:CheY-like chemotaxis protein
VNCADLVGLSVLVLEDEPLVALDIVEALKSAGASVFAANCLRDALALADHPDLSAAILDFGLRDGDAGPVCERLNRRGIPFVLYSGYENAVVRGVTLRKPATQAALIETLARLLRSKALAAQELAHRA